jgi:hypothetical protein
MDKIDAAIARHLDVIHHYNTLLAVIQDDKDHIEKLNNVLNKLREVTGAVSNMGLLEAVEKLVAESVAESAENSKK